MSREKLHRFLRIVRLKPNETFTPKSDEEAQVLGGAITNVTGTITYLFIQDKQDRSLISFMRLLAAATSTVYSLNPISINTTCAVALMTSDSRGIWFGQHIELKFVGATNSHATVILEVVKIDPKTGAHLA